MLVYQTIRSCVACGEGESYSKIVDIPLEDIRLSPAAMSCECGYFKEYYHYNVSFKKYKTTKNALLNEIQSLSSLIEHTEEDPSLPFINRYKEKLLKLKEDLFNLGDTPIPDHLWNN